jgi:hypothetical protein
MVNKKPKIAVAVALLALGADVRAQIRPTYQYPVQPESSGPAGARLLDTSLYITPIVGLAAGYDDNLFLSGGTKKTSAIYIASPGFKIDARTASTILQVSYQAQLGEYAQSSADNYVDHTGKVQYDAAFDGRTFLRLGWDYIHGHEPRGSTDRTIAAYPDKYNLSAPNITFAYGAQGAPGRVELYASDAAKRYVNNRATTTAGDRDTKEYGGAFYWRVFPKTYALVEARQTELDYVHGGPFSGTERRYYGGVSWEATAATSGTLKVGQLRRTFDNGLPSGTATSWEALVSWAPRSYSKFDFFSSRQTNESTGLGNFILSSVSGVNWTHGWSSILSTGVNLTYRRDEYQGFNRTDETKSLGLKVGYRIRRWLTLGGEYTYTKRDSNLPGFDYDKNLYMLTATGSL